MSWGQTSALFSALKNGQARVGLTSGISVKHHFPDEMNCLGPILGPVLFIESVFRGGLQATLTAGANPNAPGFCRNLGLTSMFCAGVGMSRTYVRSLHVPRRGSDEPNRHAQPRLRELTVSV